jgi:hypothetical protein
MIGIRSSRDLRDWTTALARQPEPSAPVLNEQDCYHFRVLDPRLPLRSVPQVATALTQRFHGSLSRGCTWPVSVLARIRAKITPTNSHRSSIVISSHSH